MKRGVVFGTFDHFHPGHEWFLLQASKQCNHLTVSVALDSDVERRKGRVSAHSLSLRIQTVQKFLPYATVQAGDAQEGEWTMFQHQSYDVVFVGYDQLALRGALEELKKIKHLAFNIIQLNAYFPEKYKTSLSPSSWPRPGSDRILDKPE